MPWTTVGIILRLAGACLLLESTLANAQQGKQLDAEAIAKLLNKMACGQEKDPDDAQADFAAAYTRRGFAHRTAAEREGQCAARFDKKDFDRALADFGKAIEIAPKDFSAYHLRGSAYLDYCDYRRAITDASEAIALNPTGVSAYFLRGLAYEATRDDARAGRDFKKGSALQNLGETVAKCDMLAASPLDATRAEIIPGVAFDKMEAPAAIEACRKAVAGSPDNPRLKYQLARALAKAKEPPSTYVELYGDAADRGLTVAIHNLANLYRGGEGVEKSEVDAVRLYRQAAERGLALSMFVLAEALQAGRGSAKDETAAARWYRRASDTGYPPAMTALGVMLENGQGVAKDPEQANTWYRRAAEAGEAIAARYLGINYEKGIGAPEDAGEAARWYRKAAGAGDAEASRLLAALEQGAASKDQRQ
jgi:TPR repeat protein